MAAITNRLPENIPGPVYTDDSCIDCNLCREIAPAFFSRHDGLASTVVHRQPGTPEEIELCLEALSSCPTETIGCDGT